MALGVRGVVQLIDQAAGTATVSELRRLPKASDLADVAAGRHDFLPTAMPMDRYGVSEHAVIHRADVSPEVWEALEKNRIVEGTVARPAAALPRRGYEPLRFTEDVFVTPYKPPRYAR